jgi:hypothetical protein
MMKMMMMMIMIMVIMVNKCSMKNKCQLRNKSIYKKIKKIKYINLNTIEYKNL